MISGLVSQPVSVSQCPCLSQSLSSCIERDGKGKVQLEDMSVILQGPWENHDTTEQQVSYKQSTRH